MTTVHLLTKKLWDYKNLNIHSFSHFFFVVSNLIFFSRKFFFLAQISHFFFHTFFFIGSKLKSFSQKFFYFSGISQFFLKITLFFLIYSRNVIKKNYETFEISKVFFTLFFLLKCHIFFSFRQISNFFFTLLFF